MAKIRSSVTYRDSSGKRTTVYATKESIKETEDKIRAAGLEPGKIKTGSVSRNSSGRRTYRDSSGNVEKVEEKVTLDDGRKAIKTTTYKKTSDLKGATGSGSGLNDTPELYNPQTGRKLSPIESYAVTQTYGGMTDAETGEAVYTKYTPPPKQEKRLFKEQFYREYPYLAAQKEAEVKEQIFSPATAIVRQAANKKAFEQRTEASLRSAVENAPTENAFKQAAKNLRSYKQNQILTSRESYGNLEPPTNTPGQRITAIPKSIAGGFSLGLKTVGSATEELLYEKEQKLRFKDRQSIATDETGVYALNILKDSSREAAITGLKVSRNVIGGAVTDTGSSKLQGALFAASGVLGAVSGAAKGIGAAAKVSTAAKQSVYLRSAVKGTGIGLKTVGYGALGVAGVQAARSDDPVGQLSRLGGRVIAFSGAFKTGEAAGYEFGVLAKNTAPAISKAISQIKLPETKPLGKKGAAFRGGRRVSPKSKTQIRQESKGVYRDPRVTRQKDSVTLKVRNKDLKNRFVKQRNIQIRQDGSYTVKDKGIRTDVQPLKGSGSPSNKIRYRTSQAIKNPKATGDYVLVVRPGFRKPVRVSVKQQTPFKTTSSSPGQVQILKQKPITQQTTKVTGAKNIRLNDQKSFIKGDPARSQYAAQNIQADPLKVDLGKPPTQAGTTNPGFRSGVTKGSIVGNDKITYLKSDLRNLRGASLPSGNLARSVPPRAVVLPKEGSLITGVYLSQNKEISARGITAQPSPLLSDQGTNEIAATTITYEPAVIEATTQIFDQSPRITPSGRGSRRNDFFNLPGTETPIDPVITPPTATPRTPFTPQRPQRPIPRDPPTIFPRFRFNRQREEAPIGYDVEARIGGIFKRISRSPLSLKEAVSFGASTVGGSPAASFRVLKSTRPIGARFFGNAQLSDFESRAGGIFVEKREKRINTPGEIVGITRKGQAALKTRRVFGK